ncbi:DUF1501 domain-containing protein [Gracilimonas tropica]|uniref:DUF1501 domain-containing protein n=1 Tax=Gracilimonas tropica TaxID=454600 RepID=UPI00036300AC|nr:DUF1501 domain-containing protein [Gracilimonas tropica]
MCKKDLKNPGLSHTRKGASLDDKEAHQHDHQCWSRRSFLSTLGFGAIGSSMLLGGMPISTFARSKFFNRLSRADNDRVLILIQLSGGNDGLNTIIPVENDIYYQKRPTIGIAKQDSILLSDNIGMHPAMSSLQSFWGEGNMAVINNVGYADTNRSHARATDIWTTGSGSNNIENTGWAGRFLVEDNPDFIANPPEFPLGVRIGGSATLFQSEFGNLGVTFGGAGQFTQFLEQGGFYDENNVPQNDFGQSLSFARKIANSSFKYLESIQDAADNATNIGDYPNSSLAQSLSVVARLIRGGLQTKLFLVSKGGFDTHNNQGGTEGGHANLLADIADSVQAFYADLESDNLHNRALTMTFSEFGRTLDENSSNGTDHGSSAPVMVFGPVNGGLYGNHSNLTNLDNSGDPVFSTDYRSVYTSILDDWFGLGDEETGSVIDGNFEKLGFVNAMATSTETASAPQTFMLDQNYPNPFNPTTSISFSLVHDSDVKLSIFTINGKLIRTLINERKAAGEYNVTFDARGLSSGTYLYKLETPTGTKTKKMTLIK